MGQRLFFLPVVVCLLAAAPARGGDEPVKLTLEEAVRTALRNNPAIRDAASRALGLMAAADRVGAERKLQLRLDSRYTYLSEVPSVSPFAGAPAISLGEEDAWVTSLTAQQLLFTGGRLEALVRQAAGAAKAAEISRERTAQVVAFNAERAFRLLLSAQRETEVARQSLAAAEDHRRMAASRLEARAAAAFDVIRAEVQVEEVRQDLIRAESGILTARAALLLAIGLERGDYVAVDSETPAAARPPLEELLRQARSGRLELAAAGFQITAAREGIRAAESERWPTLSVGGDYQWVEPESATQFDRWSFSALLSFPILDGGRAGARLREAKAQYSQVLAARDAIINQVEAEVRQACARVESSEAQVEVAGKRIVQAEELLRLAKVRYEGGVGTATEIADAQASLASARQGLTRALTEKGIAEAELRLATGAPLSMADIEEVTP